MLKLLRKSFLMSDIINMLKIDYSLNRYPSLTFKYLLSGDDLTLIIPSKEQYLLSRLSNEITIYYNSKNKKIKVNKENQEIDYNKKLEKHLAKCFSFIEERENFNKELSEQSRKMSKYILENQKSESRKRKRRDSILGYALSYAFDDSCDSGSSDSDSSSHHSHHDDH